MKKLIPTSLIILSIVLSPSLYAQTPPPPATKAEEPVPVPTNEVPAQTDETQEPMEVTAPEETPADEGTSVGQASNEGMRAAKKRQWTNIALAVGAVVVAVTALILVANNKGHSNKK